MAMTIEEIKGKIDAAPLSHKIEVAVSILIIELMGRHDIPIE
jgi:hypothetical protein